MKQLTKNQIQELFAFTKSHRIRYYDLQSEVVDHLASAIENKWADNPDVPFKKALDEIYAGFGIYGFGKLEQEKRDAIQRKIAWKLWAFIKSYLTPPKILLTLLLIISIYQGLSLLEDPFTVTMYMVVLFLFSTLGMILFRKRQIRHLVDKYLEVNVVFTGGFPALVVPYLLAEFLMIENDFPNGILWILAVWLVFALITAVGTYNYLEETVEEVKLQYENN